MSSATQRFEVVGELYRKATGRLRPGKSVPPECGYDSSSDENRERFEQWLAISGFTDAVDRIAELERDLRDHRMEDEALRELLVRRLGGGEDKATVDLVATVCDG